MELVRIKVADFGCVRSADVELGPGINVLYGPNDMGKSTLAQAVRAVLLLQHSSSQARAFVPWGTEAVPHVQLDFRIKGRHYRVTKSWGAGKRGRSVLEWSADGHVFSQLEAGRAVDGELRTLLGWGIAAPGGKKRQHGLPASFLSTVLLGQQATPVTVFESSLGDDDDGAARERLVEAMQALAQDPVYKSTLDAVQARVDEAFTQHGRRRTGRGSPFTRTAEQIRRRQDDYEQWDRQVLASEAVAEGLRELDARRDRLIGAACDAREQVERMSKAMERTRAREQAQQALDQVQELEALTAQERRLEASLSGAIAEQGEASEARRRAESQLHERAQRLKAVGAGGDARQRLEHESLQRRRAEVEAALTQTRRELAQAQEAAALQERVDALGGQTRELAEQLDAARAAKGLLAAAQVLADRDAARAEVARTAEQRQEVSGLRGEASALVERAQGLEHKLGKRVLPDAAELAALKALDEALRLAQARLGGGVSVRVQLHDDVEVVATRDDDAPAPAGSGSIEAQRRVQLEIGRIATVSVTAGEVAARAEVEAAQRRWADAAQSVFSTAGVEDLAELEAACSEADANAASAAQVREEAANLVRLADAREQGLGDARALAARLEALEEAWTDLGVVEADARPQIGGDLEAATEEEARLRAARDAAAAAQAETTRGLEAAASGLDASPEQARGNAEAQVARRGGELEQIDGELAALAQRQTEALRSAEREHAEAVAAAEQARAAEGEAQSRCAELRDARAQCRGAMEERRRLLDAPDDEAVRALVEQRRAALAALPEPEADVDPAQLDEAKHRSAARDRELEEASVEVRKQEGALQQVGGQVVRDKADAAREALDAARRHEHEVELDYEAWRLLLDALRGAENEQGAHLGERLGRSVSQRFERLTQGRYGAVDLGPDLDMRGLQTPGGLQQVDRFSEGLKEQMATILRICVAEQLQGALVLDDHLTQTDAARITWFRALLTEAAEQIQIIVLTCRPSDYVPPDPDQSDRFRAIDLATVMQRY